MMTGIRVYNNYMDCVHRRDIRYGDSYDVKVVINEAHFGGDNILDGSYFHGVAVMDKYQFGGSWFYVEDMMDEY